MVVEVMAMDPLAANVSRQAIGEFDEGGSEDESEGIVRLVEMRISGQKADGVMVKLGFPFSRRVEARRFVGGIWAFWKDQINVQVLFSNPQFVHLLYKMRIGWASFSSLVFMPLQYEPGVTGCGKTLTI
ncbi:hypothetical protein J1N35_014933 [Gossypium stocksii]|uniref:DUF4283 domain-containing protein n=1 Tax=Gossypium stocksii TaxID=47602 RepID=A0A9D3VV64_9ROSI|nr:hypothetical protein J1N35_014933 [Gossypium stocksii]